MKITKELVFFITGGASGLGESAVRDIHAQGARVAIADMNEERLQLLKSELKERVIVMRCDVTKEEEVKGEEEERGEGKERERVEERAGEEGKKEEVK